MKITFSTLGCKLNFAETSAIGKQLVARGHQKAKANDVVDICILNTCSVTDVADQKGRQAIRRLHREHPSARIIVTGCYAQLKPEEVASIEGVDYVVGSNDKHRIPEIVAQIEADMLARQDSIQDATSSDTQGRASSSPTLSEGLRHSCEIEVTDLQSAQGRLSEAGAAFHPFYSKDDRTRCFLKVQDGCDYYCTYCTIPMARGKSRNGTIQSTVQMAEQAIAEGAREIVLTGVNIGDFGRSTGETFLQLIQALDAVEGEVRYRISSCEPNLLSDDIIEFVAHSRHFAPHFHIPLQSGSNEVLKIMHRRYTRELFAERIAHIRKVMPHAFVGVDCMVGVRGETPEMFADYASFIDSLNVQQLHVFPYSERANTRMVEMDLQRVPPQEQKRRVEVLMAISKRHLDAFYAAHQGSTGIVLWESGREKDAEGRALMAGWTENYIRVTAPYTKEKINTFESIVI